MIAPALAPFDMAARSAQVRAALVAQGATSLVVTNLTNVRWLTGFTGSFGLAVISADQLVLVTDGRYSDQAPAQLDAAGVDASIAITNDLYGSLTGYELGATVAVEADHLSWADHQRLQRDLTPTIVALETDLVVHRAVKDAGELDRIRHAADIADAALAEVRPLLGQRASERSVALALEVAMRERGATSSAYETIVGAAANGALPHGRPTNYVIADGDLVVIDVGALYDGYRSDMTRTYCIGEPTPKQRRQLDVVLEAQQAGVAEVRHGAPTKAVDAACRTVITNAGWGERFTHGTGHGVGLDIHEHPRLNSRSTDVLVTNMLATVEPGVYLPGEGGCRWEDLMIVTADGAEVVTHSPKEAIVV